MPVRDPALREQLAQAIVIGFVTVVVVGHFRRAFADFPANPARICLVV